MQGFHKSQALFSTTIDITIIANPKIEPLSVVDSIKAEVFEEASSVVFSLPLGALNISWKKLETWFIMSITVSLMFWNISAMVIPDSLDSDEPTNEVSDSA